jgi:hypothetical protein
LEMVEHACCALRVFSGGGQCHTLVAPNGGASAGEDAAAARHRTASARGMPRSVAPLGIGRRTATPARGVETMDTARGAIVLCALARRDLQG